MTIDLPLAERENVNSKWLSGFVTGDADKKIETINHFLVGRDISIFLSGLIIGVIFTLFGWWYRGGVGMPTFFSGSSIIPERRPSPTPGIVTGQYGTFRVRATNVYLRRCPGFECEPVTMLQRGENVTFLGERDFISGQEWYYVRAGSREGWVSRYYLD